MSKDCQDGGIVFGDWKLVPVDSRNWELCHLHETQPTGRNKGGVTKWNRCGRFYQYNTIDQALQYAIDCEMKDKHHEQAAKIGAALLEYDSLTRFFVSAVREALDGRE